MPDTKIAFEDIQPATDGLIEQLTDTARQYHDGFPEGSGGNETLWGLNLASFMGERMATVLARLRERERDLETMVELANRVHRFGDTDAVTALCEEIWAFEDRVKS